MNRYISGDIAEFSDKSIFVYIVWRRHSLGTSRYIFGNTKEACLDEAKITELKYRKYYFNSIKSSFSPTTPFNYNVDRHTQESDYYKDIIFFREYTFPYTDSDTIYIFYAWSSFSSSPDIAFGPTPKECLANARTKHPFFFNGSGSSINNEKEKELITHGTYTPFVQQTGNIRIYYLKKHKLK